MLELMFCRVFTRMFLGGLRVDGDLLLCWLCAGLLICCLRLLDVGLSVWFNFRLSDFLVLHFGWLVMVLFWGLLALILVVEFFVCVCLLVFSWFWVGERCFVVFELVLLWSDAVHFDFRNFVYCLTWNCLRILVYWLNIWLILWFWVLIVDRLC